MQTIISRHSYKATFSLYVVVIAIIFLPFLLKGEVICPFDYNTDFGASTDINDSSYTSNRKFGDYSHFFIPETDHNLQNKGRSWISVWSPWGESGRPTFTCQGIFGKSYLLTNILSYIVRDAFVFQTYYAVLMIFLSGTFLFLFLCELDLHPVACGTMAIAYSTCTFLYYWISFNIYLSIFCWSAALLWLITRYLKTMSFWTWLGLVFATYSLLMTGYQQLIVMFAYLLLVYSVFHIWGLPIARRAKVVRAGLLGLAACVGVIAALPLYLDIYITAKNSARLQVDDSFFLGVLPHVNSIAALVHYVGLFFDPYLHGNPITSKDPRSFSGVSLTPLYFSLLLLSLRISIKRRIWGWHLLIGACIVTTLWPKAYLILVHYFGFNFSRIQTLCGALIPAFVVIAYLIDDLLESKNVDQLPKGQSVMLFSTVVVVGVGILTAAAKDKVDIYDLGHFSLVRMTCAIFLLVGFTTFVSTKHKWTLLVLTVFTAVLYAKPLVLKRPLNDIHRSSRLVEKIRDSLPAGQRYAFVEPTGLLPPNMDSLLHLRSVHTYNSLSSKNFQQYIASLGGETRVYGRYSEFIGKDLSARPAFSYSGIGLILSRSPLQDHGFKQIGEESGLRFYKPLKDPLLYAQVSSYAQAQGNRCYLSGHLFDHSSLPVSRLEEYDDYQKYKVSDSRSDTLLFVSQQYHSKWRATTDRGPAIVTRVNDFFLGVVVPAGSKWVEIEFRPYVYWSFIPQVVFLISFLAFLCHVIVSWSRERKKLRVP